MIAKVAHLLARNGPETVEQMLARVSTYSPETLRRARVRIDIMAMSLNRDYLRHLLTSSLSDSVDIYMYVDSSPQWRRQLDFFAVAFDVIVNGVCTRRLAPLTTIDMLDKVGKQVAAARSKVHESVSRCA